MPAISDSLARVLGVKPAPVVLAGLQLKVTIEASRLDGEPAFTPVTSSLKLSSPDNPEMRETNVNQASVFLNGMTRSFVSQLSAALPGDVAVAPADPKILTMPKMSRDDLS